MPQPAAKRLIRVLVVDDSALVRSLIRKGLAQHPEIEVVGEAVDGVDAITQITRLRPDVVTLDVEMPRLNGIGVLERVVGKMPVKFLMVSTLTQSGAQVTFEALRKGAVDYVTKPQMASQTAMPTFRQELHEKVVTVARSRRVSRRSTTLGPSQSAPTLPPNHVRGWLITIGISCGGPQSLYEMLPAFPSDFVPILITQHMPPQFTTAFAQHLNQRCAMNVREAAHNDPIKHGTVYIAPGSHHMGLARQGIELRVRLDDGPLVSGHRPSADFMLTAAARVCGPRTVGVIMTGMGRDGAEGIVRVSEAGGITIGQDQESCFVYGMPKAAAATGRLQHVVPLKDIPAKIAAAIESGRAARAAVP
jgi:two-component system chemotaxis response regulator CheB